MITISETRPMNSSFSTKLPSLQLAWDSTSLGELKFCAQRYKYVIIDGYESHGTNVHLRWGIEFGSATEVYGREIVDGTNPRDALHAAVKYALASTWDKELGRPWVSEDDTKNRETLIQAIVDYADHYENDPLKVLKLPDGSAAAELSFNFEIPGHEESCTGESFVFCGYLDWVAMWQGHSWIVDTKTTGKALNKAYFARYSPDNQMSLYALSKQIVFPDLDPIDRIARVIINAVRPVRNGPTEFQRGFVERTEPQLEEWLRHATFYIGLAELFAQRNEWPQNDKACGATYLDSKTGEISYGCPFRPVCGSDPSIREELLRLNFRRRVWDPLKIRQAKSDPTKLKQELEL